MSAAGPLDFLPLFRSRRDHFRALLTFSRRQQELIASGDYSELLAVLGHKQQILSQMEELHRARPDLRTRWHEERHRLDAADRRSCDDLLADSEALLAELLEHEQSSTLRLAERRDDTQRQLAAIAQGSQVHDAYRDQLAPVTHRHLDTGR